MPNIPVTSGDETVAVSNGDTVNLDNFPDGETITIEAGRANVRNFRIDFGDNDNTANKVIIDIDSFARDGLQILVVGYDPLDALQLEGAENLQAGVPTINQLTFSYGDGFTGRVKILDPGERDLLGDPPPIIICFADGTIIDTEVGPRPVESILVGDRVKTVDHGNQSVRWIGQRKLEPSELSEHPNLLPIEFQAGSMGFNLPWKDLVVSPQHRLRVNDWRAEYLFGCSEVLVPAKAFLNSPGVRILKEWTGSYFHLLFDCHELIWSNGLISESLHPGEIALSALNQDLDEEFLKKHLERSVDVKTSRPGIRVMEARALNLYAA